jgi:hypothetical protein
VVVTDGDTEVVRPCRGMTEAGLADFGGGVLRRRGPAGYAMAFVWLGFLVVPLINAIEHKESTLAYVATIVATATFVVSYVWLVLVFRRAVARRYVLAVYALSLAIAIRADGGGSVRVGVPVHLLRRRDRDSRAAPARTPRRRRVRRAGRRHVVARWRFWWDRGGARRQHRRRRVADDPPA